ncbi:MAG: tRNA threonylcarbamoyladenosine dehydratase [Spirochaetota bacterium]
MADFTERTVRLIGEQNVRRLKGSTVAVFGLGGVGSYALEAVARAGVGRIIIADFDTVDITNINRQLLTLHSNIGMEKTALAAERIREINPGCTVFPHQTRICTDTLPLFDGYAIDAAIDCIDSVEDKIELLVYLNRRKIITVSSMGAALKTDPSRIEVMPIHETRVCPLAKRIRRALRERNVSEGGIYAVSSTEAPIPLRERPLGSISYLPALFGLHCAAETLLHLAPLSDYPA